MRVNNRELSSENRAEPVRESTVCPDEECLPPDALARIREIKAAVAGDIKDNITETL